MARKTLFIAAGVLALLLAGAGYYFLYLPRQESASTSAPAPASSPVAAAASALAPKAGRAGAQPNPIILVLDRSAIRTSSKVGQDITRQMQAYTDQARRDIQGQAAALQAQATQLQQTAASLTPEERQSRADALEAKQVALQTKAQNKQEQLTATMDAAYGAVDKALSPVVAEVVKQRGGNLVLDRLALPYAQPDMDITAQAIAELDAKMPSYHVTLLATP